MSERLILALDGSTDVCSTALLGVDEDRGGDSPCLLAKCSEHSGRGQAGILLSMVDEMLEEIGAGPSDLGSVVVGIGPGTFTGVRIAVATARGIALALDVPVFGKSSLAALAASVLDSASPGQRSGWERIVPVIDARRHQVFYAVYEAGGKSGTDDVCKWTRGGPIAVCDMGCLDEVVKDVNGHAVVVGADEEFVGGLPEQAVFLRRDVQAEYLLLGQRWLIEGRAHDAKAIGHDGDEDQVPAGSPERVRPIYVRVPDADIHITKMKDPWANGSARQ